MKKTIAALMALVMACGIAGCSESSTSGTAADSSSAVQKESSSAEASTDTETETETVTETTTAPVTDEPSQAETTLSEAADPNETPGGDSGDIAASAIDASQTSEEKPAQIGEWVGTTIYSATDKKYHTVYTRVTNVVSKSDDEDYVNKAIELHNSLSSENYQLDEKELKIPSDCELCVMVYEVYVPEDFPSQDWGITAPDIGYSAVNIGGGGIPSADGASTYIGMGGITELTTQKENKYNVGNTYSFSNIFLMVKGYENYDFVYSSYPDGTLSDDIGSVETVKAYHSAK